MKKNTLALVLAVLGLFIVGCTTQSDEDAIRDLIGRSAYTDDNGIRSYAGRDTSVSEGGDESMADGERIPFVRFVRYIPPDGVTRTVQVDIPAYPGYPDTTALATVRYTIRGEFRTVFDTTTTPILVWRKPFVDEAVRRVYLTKQGKRWRVRRLSPLRFYTTGAPYELSLAQMELHARSWPEADTYRLTTADTLLAKTELPSFTYADTVWVRVTVTSNGDSAWVFLHHGRPQWPYRARRAYWKQSTYVFERTWCIGSEGTVRKPEVRPSGHDAIGWGTLWADTSQPYVAAAWGLPYVVRSPGEPIPEENE